MAEMNIWDKFDNAIDTKGLAEDVKDALDAGMNVHIAKPIDMELLKKTLNQYVKRQP